jgi:hypothetical protein
MGYEEKQRKFIEQYDIKVGSILKVIRKHTVADNKLAWECCWESNGMDDMIDGEYQVDGIGPSGFSLDEWWFPYYCLEFVSNPTPWEMAKYKYPSLRASKYSMKDKSIIMGLINSDNFTDLYEDEFMHLLKLALNP